MMTDEEQNAEAFLLAVSGVQSANLSPIQKYKAIIALAVNEI